MRDVMGDRNRFVMEVKASVHDLLFIFLPWLSALTGLAAHTLFAIRYGFTGFERCFFVAAAGQCETKNDS